MTLSAKPSDFRRRFQGELFPALAEEVGPLPGTHRRFVAAPDLVGVEGFVGAPGGGPGRPPEDRRALARAFLAKAVWDLPTTRHLIDRLEADPSLRRLCGWSRLGAIPSEATFSRAFAEFSASRLAERMHEALVVDAPGETLVGHVSRDATAIEGREVAKPKKVKKPKRGRPRKGEERPKTPSRLKRQAGGMSLDAMLADIPKVCDRGTKKNARGIRETWRGYKLHIDTADCGVPLGAILTSASLHDSQVAIPLATMTADRVANLHDLMDSACDATEIHTVSERFGHVPIIATNPRRDKALKDDLNREARAQRAAGHPDARTLRYRIRPVVERTNARLKDAFGARHVRVRGPTKVTCHLMSGLLALTADRIIRLAAPWRRPTRSTDPTLCPPTGTATKRSSSNAPKTPRRPCPILSLLPKPPSAAQPIP